MVSSGAVFYGSVGGAHCLLKWSFSGQTVTEALAHTEAVGEGGKVAGKETHEEEKGETQ